MEFKKIIAAALYYIYKYRKNLIKALAWPFAALIAINLISYYEIFSTNGIVEGLITILVQSIFAITTHRIVLLGPESIPEWGLTSWTKREIFYLLHVFGLVLISIPVSMLGSIPIMGSVIAVVIIFWFGGRLCLVFPGIAVDNGVSFEESWNLTKNYKLLMFLVVIAFPLLITLPSIALSFIPYGGSISIILSTLIIVFEVAALSMVYQYIMSQNEAMG